MNVVKLHQGSRCPSMSEHSPNVNWKAIIVEARRLVVVPD